MRVAFLAVTYPPSVGGAQSHVRHLAEGLAARGHDVEVLTLDILRSPAGREPGRVGAPREHRGGVEIRRFPLARRAHVVVRTVDRAVGHLVRGGRRESPVRMGPFSARLAVAAVAAGRRCDVVVGCSVPFTTVLLPRGAAWGGAAAVAMPLLHLSQGSPARSVRWSLRGCHAVSASTTSERDSHVAIGVPADRICVLPPGCEPDAFPDRDPATARRELGLPDRPTVGYVGRLAAYKGVDTLLAAARRVWAERADTTVLLAGADTRWDGLQRLVDDLSSEAGDRLVVRRGFPDDDKAALLSACDVVALPSRDESFGMVIAEAWSARRPVVAADIPAVRCVIRPGVDGELVPVGDADRVAEEVLTLLADPARRHRYGAAGRRRVEDELAWDRIVDGWEGLLVAAVDRRDVRRRAPRGGGRPCAA